MGVDLPRMEEPDLPEAEPGWWEKRQFQLLGACDQLESWLEKRQDEPYKMLVFERYVSQQIMEGEDVDQNLNWLAYLYREYPQPFWEAGFTHETGLDRVADRMAHTIRAWERSTSMPSTGPGKELSEQQEQTLKVLKNNPNLCIRLLMIVLEAHKNGVAFHHNLAHYMLPLIKRGRALESTYQRQDWTQALLEHGEPDTIGDRMGYYARAEDVREQLPWIIEQYPQAIPPLLTSFTQRRQHTRDGETLPDELFQQMLGSSHPQVRKTAMRTMGRQGNQYPPTARKPTGKSS